MTEDEAKKKACCGPPHAGKRSTCDGSITCAGSACMAWRGRKTRTFEMRAEAEFRRSGRQLYAEGPDIEGYCGLAGVPR